VVAKKISSGSVTRTRPLCKYPQKAVYNGSGNIDDAASFACR
jgi:feruloyl esterase